MSKNACEKCRHLKATTVNVPEGTRVPRRKVKIVCMARRMNMNGKKIVHCSKFKDRRGRK